MWLKEGDRNTRFFHQKAVWRARKNRIRRLKASNGQWCENPDQMAAMATAFFKDLYTKDTGVIPDHLVSMLHARVTNEMNDELCREFSEKEISDALFQIGSFILLSFNYGVLFLLLQVFPAAEWLTGSKVPLKYSLKTITDMVKEQLTHENVRYVLMASCHSG